MTGWAHNARRDPCDRYHFPDRTRLHSWMMYVGVNNNTPTHLLDTASRSRCRSSKAPFILRGTHHARPHSQEIRSKSNHGVWSVRRKHRRVEMLERVDGSTWNVLLFPGE